MWEQEGVRSQSCGWLDGREWPLVKQKCDRLWPIRPLGLDCKRGPKQGSKMIRLAHLDEGVVCRPSIGLSSGRFKRVYAGHLEWDIGEWLPEVDSIRRPWTQACRAGEERKRDAQKQDQ